MAASTSATSTAASTAAASTAASTSITIADKYQLLKKIGAGTYGKIFMARNTSNDQADQADAVAVKILPLRHKDLMLNEVRIYEKIKGVKGIPSLYGAGSDPRFHYMIIELLEQSLEQLVYTQQKLPLKVVLHLGVQILNIVEELHARGIVHRDLKPANFLLKNDRHNISHLYLIDFGLSNSFLDEKAKHCSIRTNETLAGTARYMSVNVHQGLTASRRDDLETVGYILMFLYHGVLPWQNDDNRNNTFNEIAEQKLALNWMSGTVSEFVVFIRYCRNLGYTDKPHYDYLRSLLQNLDKIA